MNDQKNYNLIVILGPTASGKTGLAVRLAGESGSEIISADSRQVYRGMDIGTGKELEEYGNIPYHLIDIIDPAEEFSLFDYQQAFYEIFNDLRKRDIIPIMAGGTGLYLDAVIRAYDMLKVPQNRALRLELEPLSEEEIAERLLKLNPALHNTTDLKIKERIIRAIEIAIYEEEKGDEGPVHPEIIPLVTGVRWKREVLRARITKRLKARLDAGLIDEVRFLHKSGISWERLDLFGLEYRFVAMYLKGEINKNDMFQKLNRAIHQFAKRQETWFRRMEKHGVKIEWIEEGDYERLKSYVIHEIPSLR
ncbi:MAG: tRNA (adenosine(37)-N6)-dimethylallyltransferase MiaA [Deltaproteobacteria bacterium]|nr:tRNA (adenosine(37)-N6)-dimethylallyltransferase MiaA [Deltaproteobacteria bacterium]